GIAEFVGVMEDTAAAQAPDIINAPDDRDLRLELLFLYDFEIVEVDDPMVLEHGHEGLPQHEDDQPEQELTQSAGSVYHSHEDEVIQGYFAELRGVLEGVFEGEAS